ncbi:MAG: 50S ribosomal protein L10 [Candidatus Margulisbacteria bacterium]|nr:50S ribosomal protein L10 [Candidatus Margulisiibacteriota bacterium]
MPKPIKVEKVKEIQEKFANSEMAIFADYRGLTVAEVTDLRKQLRDSGIEYKVYKNTMAKIAADNLKFSGIENVFKGPMAIAFAKDPITPAKIISKFAKNNKALEIKGGVYEKKFLGVSDIQKLATFLSREEALTKIAVLLNSIIGGFARVVDAVRQQKEGQ